MIRYKKLLAVMISTRDEGILSVADARLYTNEQLAALVGRTSLILMDAKKVKHFLVEGAKLGRQELPMRRVRTLLNTYLTNNYPTAKIGFDKINDVITINLIPEIEVDLDGEES